MSNWKYEGDVEGMRVVGYNGGANGHFNNVNFVNSNGKIFDLSTDYFGRLHFSESKTGKISNQNNITDSYDIKGLRIVNTGGLGEGFYRTLLLVKDGSQKRFVVECPYQGIIDIHPIGKSYENIVPPKEFPDLYGPDRKRRVNKIKSKRKIVKKCRCKKS
jgi:hypothetical protein